MNSRRGARSRVLIVDNNEDVLNTLDKLLTEEGFDTRTTWSGHEALALIRSQPFDVLLVDDYLADLHEAAEIRILDPELAAP